MIVVEGPDGAGKTTLIEKLKERWGLEVAPRVVSKEAKALVDLRQWVEDNLRGAPHNLIFDRYRLISEPIYGPILRNNQQPGFTDVGWMMWMTQEFYKANPLVIYCLPPFRVVQANIADDPTNSVVWDKIEQIYAAYVARAALDSALSPRSTVIYDYTRDGREDDPLGCFNHWTGIIQHRKRILG